MSNALAIRSQGLTALSDGLQIKKGQLVPTPSLLEGIRLAEQLQKDIDDFYGSIRTFLEAHKCKGGKGDWGYVQLTPMSRLYGDDTVKPRFLKQVVDTEQVRTWQKLHGGQLPAGVTEKISTRLTKKVK